VKAAVGDGAAFGVRVTYIEQSEPLGLAHAVLISEEYLGDDSFVMYLGDNLILGGIKELVREFENEKPNAQILLSRVPNPNQFGVAELKDGKVVRLVEKPESPVSDLALVGVYMFDKNVMEAVKGIKPSGRGELEITDAIQYLIDHGYTVHPHMVKGWWKDTGKLDDMLEANRMVLDSLERRLDGHVDSVSRVEFKVVVEKGAEVINSVIRGPAIIGAGARVVNSFIGPFTAIDRNVQVYGSEIEHSIILEGSSVNEVDRRIEDSLIGRNVEVGKSPLKPTAYRFMLGDNSKVGLL